MTFVCDQEKALGVCCRALRLARTANGDPHHNLCGSRADLLTDLSPFRWSVAAIELFGSPAGESVWSSSG